MPKYENGLIYKLVCNDDYDNENIYIGSTTNFKTRKCQHKSACNNLNNNEYNNKKYQYIRESGGFENWCMVQIEPFPCKGVKELEARERYWVEQLKSKLNSCIPTQTKKEYYENNKETILQQTKEYRNNNIEIIAEKMAEYRKNNKEKLVEHYQNNKEKIAEKMVEYYQNKKERVKIICDCGCEVTKYNILKHQKNPKHLKLMVLSGEKKIFCICKEDI